MPCVDPLPKVNHNGVETTSIITYKEWEPGKEYTKNIVLKNVKVKTLKLTYKTPNSRFFSTLYPKQITLSAGTSFVLPVTFRPLEKNVYEDQISFLSQEGEFSIPIKAVLPEFNISMPEKLSLPICAVNDETQTGFTVKNKSKKFYIDSELVTPFKWNVEGPFVIQPATGTLQPHESQRMNITFQPQSASVYECKAQLTYGMNFDVFSYTTLHGLSKYPQLLVSCNNERSTDVSLDFGHLPIGTNLQKFVEVFNLSEVEAKCFIEQPSAIFAVDKVFSCSNTKVNVPPKSSAKFSINYKPEAVNSDSIDYMYINSISNINKLAIKCTGHCSGPDVKLSTNIINFSLINVGESATRTIELTNDSAAATHYQFRIDCRESVFKFDTLSGQILPAEKLKVIIKFWPTHPINYYRTVYCVVDNQPPLTLDLLGTAHSETVKPAVLEVKHIEQFRIHSERGLTMFPPEQLNEMLAHNKLELDANNTLINPTAESIEPWLNPVASVPLEDQYFNDGHHSDIVHSHPLVTLDTIYADFGRCQDIKNIEAKTIRLTNHTQGKMVAEWMGNSGHSFYMVPSMLEIPPLKTVDFRVHFRPDSVNQFYGNELECFCYYKSLRDYRLVESLTHAPPVCLTITAVGSTFQPNSTPFLPQFSLSVEDLVFPASNQNEASYRTFAVTNQAATPIVYEFPDSGVFTVKPRSGIISSKLEIFTVKALPTSIKKYRSCLHMHMNQDARYTKEIPVICTAETPEILLSNEGEIYFRETCVGTASRHSYKVKNISRMPLEFHWSLTRDEQSLLRIEPSAGKILPNEYQDHSFIFTPKDTQPFVMRPRLVVTAQGQSKTDSSGKPKAFLVRCLGQGTVGELMVDEPIIEMGDIMVGTSHARLFNIYNESNCALKYRLNVHQKVEGPPADLQLMTCSLTLDTYDGEIPAKSKRCVRAVITPLMRCLHCFEISYELITPEASATTHQAQSLLKVFTTGVFPLMMIKDARIHGSGIGIGKRQLWSLFQLDSLNTYLDSDPSERERVYSVQTRSSMRRRPPVLTRAIVDFNFGAAPVNSEPCYVTLYVENTGTLDCEWQFLFPNDLQMELEYWSENGEYTEDELHEMKVMDNKLFTVNPQSGKLKPGETCSVVFVYHHVMPGTDRLPVLLKQTRGREILINLVGVTVEADVPYIHFPSSSHRFAPIAVGESQCPKQLYEMYNGGSVPVQFEIDTLALDLLKTDNFNHDILACLNPRGAIAPGESYIIEWVFHPLEARTYEVAVPIHISGGETALVNFIGIGYDKNQLREAMPTATESDNSPVPPKQIVTVPGQKAILSQERLSLGNVPLFSDTRQVLFITNTSDHVISFSWHVRSTGDQEMLNITPAQGILQPAASQMVKVIFTSVGEPAFYDMDVICELVDETDSAQFRRQLRDWENERERQIHEFTITEKDLVKQKSTSSKKMSNRSPSDSGIESDSPRGVEIYKEKHEENIYKPYKTLPPILDKSIDKDRMKLKEQESSQVLLWQKPIPPSPFLLHLGITARTHTITTFQENFFDDMKNFHIDKAKRFAHQNESEQQIQKEFNNISCTEAEKELLSGVISNVLRSLVDDPSFRQSVTKLSNESIPYFNQFQPDTKQAQTESLSVLNSQKQPEQKLKPAKSPSKTDSSNRIQLQMTALAPSSNLSKSTKKARVDEPFTDESIARSQCVLI